MSSKQMEQHPSSKEAEESWTEATLPPTSSCIFCMFFSFSDERLTTLSIILLIIFETNVFTERVRMGIRWSKRYAMIEIVKKIQFYN
jgi:hypothetical protein